MGKRKILVVDDEKAFLEMVALRLRNAGYDVVTAEDGYEAFKKAHLEEPDAIILDIFLPRMDGYELCSLMKADTKLNKIPVILLTCVSRREDMDLGMASGADAYITKPFDDKTLLETIKSLL